MRRSVFVVALRIVSVAVFTFWGFDAVAQYRAEFISYDIRAEADGDKTVGSKYWRALDLVDDGEVWRATVDIPALWLDREVFVRDPLYSGAFRLSVNGHEAAMESGVTSFLREGVNVFEVRAPGGAVPEGFFLFSQPRIRVVDFIASGHHDEEVRDAVLDLQVVVRNGFNMPERVTVGYDIYDPAGRLKDFVFRDVTIAGRSVDTVRFYQKVTGTAANQYSTKNPRLYRVTISLRHNGLHTEYIPFKVGFGAAALHGVESLRGALYLSGPQPKSVYDKYEREGRLVVDRAAVPVVDGEPGGPNDPASVGLFLDRQRSMFHRNRNRANVVGWAIAPAMGNGYNMYKSYQWLKGVEPARPVIYSGADGEWNTDER